MAFKFKFYNALGALLFAAFYAVPSPAHAAAPAEIDVPAWFKNSFLDLRDDLKEATASRKRLVLYFGQNGCPYCKRLMDVNWRQPDIVAKTRRHFDVIEINIFGSREVNWLDGRPRSEKDLAALLKVQFTPTLLFLDERGEIALRVNGYYPPPRFSAALEYVAGKHERQESFAEFAARRLQPAPAAAARDEQLFRPAPYVLDRRKPAARPLAVFFEGPGCTACDEMHATALKAGATRELLSQFDVYRLDLTSAIPVVSPAGERTTAAAWGRQLNVSYTPSILLFDAAGREVFRVEAYVRTFHLQAALDYAASRAYEREPNFQRYIQARADARRERGEQVDVMK